MTSPVQQHRPLRQAIEVDPSVFDAYVGRYHLTSEMTLTVVREGSRLLAQASGQGRFEIFPESPRTFFAKVAAIGIEFEIDAAGRVVSLVLRQNGANLRARRIE